MPAGNIRRLPMGFPRLPAAAAPLALALALTVTAPAPAPAQTWNSTTDRNWGVAGNWNPTTVPNSATATAVFGGIGPGAITFATGGTAFTVGTLSFTAGGYTLDPAGSLTLSTLTNSAGVNEIRSRLTANNLTANITGGTLTLNNVRSGAPN